MRGVLREALPQLWWSQITVGDPFADAMIATTQKFQTLAQFGP
jgi:hypothetical protein